MANSKINKSAIIKRGTVSGTGDSNGFLDTEFKSNEIAIIGCTQLRIDGQTITPAFMNVAYFGGTGGEYNTLQFETWSHSILGKNQPIIAQIAYIEI